MTESLIHSVDKTDLKTPAGPSLRGDLYFCKLPPGVLAGRKQEEERYGRQAKKRRKGWQEGRQKKQEGKKNNGHKNKSASGSKHCFKILDQSYSGL